MSASVQGNEVRKILAQFDAPAFVRRARGVEVADELLRAILVRQREEWLPMPRLRLAQLHATLGEWSRLADIGIPAERASHLAEQLAQLCELWRPVLKRPVPYAVVAGMARPVYGQLAESFRRFNRRWKPFVERLDLSVINTIRDEYNRYYVIEKECSTGSALLANRDFVPLAPETPATLLQAYPLLPDCPALPGT